MLPIFYCCWMFWVLMTSCDAFALICQSSTIMGKAFWDTSKGILGQPPDISQYADYILRVDGKAQADLDYSSRASGSQTTWNGVRFSETLSECLAGPLCTDKAFKLQNTLYSTKISFGKRSVIVQNEVQWPDFQYAQSFVGGSRFAMSGANGKATVWMAGCAPPQFKIRVTYFVSSEPDGGAVCRRRVITFLETKEDSTVAYQCSMWYGTNGLRVLMDVGNLLVGYTERRLKAMVKLRGVAFSNSVDGIRELLYSDNQINNILDCLEPPTGAIGGKWAAGDPGTCVKCISQQSTTHMRSRYCNRSLALDRGADCCYECAQGYMMQANVCVLNCRRNRQFNSRTGSCEACVVGKFSNGATDSCKTCAERGVPNGRIDSLRGCVACDATSLAVDGVCEACQRTPEQEVVQAGSSKCEKCSSLGAMYFSPMASKCELCPAGTFMRPTTTSCTTCPLNAYASVRGATACTSCADGFRSVPDRSTCVACPLIDQVTMFYSRYYEPGCNRQCAVGLAYATKNPYEPYACKACSTLAIPVGMFRPSNGDCSRPLPCTNALVAGGVYSGSGNSAGVCPFQCNAGFSGAQCTPCFHAQFDATKHMWIGPGCIYSCKSGMYRDAALVCTTPCVDLLVQTRVLRRVSEYTASSARPHYELGVCGKLDTVPTSDIPFLRKARWGYLADYSGHVCGNSLLEMSEACDDGNVVNGDGCSSTCAVETGYWDCDLVGTACLPKCGWNTRATDAWGLGLNGFLLPACEGARCNCTGISYYVVSQKALNERRPFMLTRFATCNCDGNVMRTIPYVVCLFFCVFCLRFWVIKY